MVVTKNLDFILIPYWNIRMVVSWRLGMVIVVIVTGWSAIVIVTAWPAVSLGLSWVADWGSLSSIHIFLF